MFEDGDAESFENRLDMGHLGVKIFRGGITIRFVRFIEFMTKRRSGAVHRNGDVIDLLLPNQLQEGCKKPVDGADVLPI